MWFFRRFRFRILTVVCILTRSNEWSLLHTQTTVHGVCRSANSKLKLVKWIMEPNRDMSGELKCTDSQAVLLHAAGVWRQSGYSSEAPHESFISVFEHWSDWVLAQRLDSALEESTKSKFSHVSMPWGNTEHPWDKRSRKKVQQTFC